MLQPFWWASAATVPAAGYWSNECGWRHPSSNSAVRRRPAASARGVMTSGFQRTVPFGGLAVGKDVETSMHQIGRAAGNLSRGPGLGVYG